MPRAELDAMPASPEAFRAFYAHALPSVYSYLFHRVGGETAVAEDLTQETFTAAVTEIRRGRSADDPVAWVMGIARHKLLDHYRRREREERKLRLAWSAAPEEAEDVFDDEVSRERALEALATLPASQRAVLVLRYLDGMSVPEVAHALGKTVHATESLLARGRERFRRAYTETDDG